MLHPPLDPELRKRLRNRHSSARFRERQRLHVAELQAQIAHLEHANRRLELRLAQLFELQPSRARVPSAADVEFAVREDEEVQSTATVEVLSDEELLLAIHRSAVAANRTATALSSSSCVGHFRDIGATRAW